MTSTKRTKKKNRQTPEERRAKMEAIAARLEDGVDGILDSEEFKRYLSFVARFHHYSPNNVLLILSQKPDATMVAGYRAWQRMGRQVRKGERGIAILAPKRYTRTVEDEKTGEKTRVSGLKGFTAGCVFDVSQTDGEPIPERPSARMLTGESSEAMALYGRLVAHALDEGIEIRFAGAETLGGAKGLYSRRSASQTTSPAKITLLEGMAADQTTKTLLHEVVHHELHKDVLFGSRASKEIEAEGTAFVVLEHYGIDSSDYSFAYVAGWAGERAAFKAALKTIQQAADELIGRLEVRRDGAGNPVEEASNE